MQKLFQTVAAVFVLSHDGYGGDWPGWRGPKGMGITGEENLPQTWGGENGENIVWKSPLPGHGSAAGSDGMPQFDHNQSSPIVWQGVNPVDGHVEWWADHPGDVCSPVFGGGIVYSENGRGGAGIAIDPTGSGDVSKPHVKWKTIPAAESYSSLVISGDYVCRLQTPGVLRCCDENGQRAVSAAHEPVTKCATFSILRILSHIHSFKPSQAQDP